MKKKLLLIIIIVVVLLLAAGAAYMFVLKPKADAEAAAKAEAEQIAAMEAEAEDEAAAEEGADPVTTKKPKAKKTPELSEKEKEKIEENTFYFDTGDSYIVNIKDSSKMLKTALTLQVNDVHYEEEFKKKAKVIRGVILRELRNMSEELLLKGSEDEIKDILLTAVSDELGVECIEKIYFTEFIIQ